MIDPPGGYVLGRLDHDTDTSKEATLRTFPHDAFRHLRREGTAACDKLWQISLFCAAIGRCRALGLGRLMRRARLADVLAEIMAQLHTLRIWPIERFHDPLHAAQSDDLIDALDLVHGPRRCGSSRCCSDGSVAQRTNLASALDDLLLGVADDLERVDEDNVQCLVWPFGCLFRGCRGARPASPAGT